MPSTPSPPGSPYARLLAEPRRFRFDAAVRVLARDAETADSAAAARFRSAPGLAYPAAEVSNVAPPRNGGSPELTTAAIGLTGAAGVLPRLYTETLTGTLRNGSHALHDFMDLLSHRMVAMFAGAAVKYRLARSAETAAWSGRPDDDRAAEALLAFSGFATPHLVPRLAVGAEPLLHYSGFFSARPRSAERLRALLSDWLGRPVEIVQFAGTWLVLAPDQRTAMPQGRHPGAWNRLGVDAAIGVRAWDPQGRIVVRIGPLDYRSFATLLPDSSGLQHLVSLIRAYLGYEIGFAVNPVLMGSEIPPLRLGVGPGPLARLGWNTWMPVSEPEVPGIARRDADEALFEAEIVEAEALQARGRQ
ncbi:MAG: type VI secretion system baseplate subunit TssG [Alphaproteobacteria bacterium]